MSLILNIDTANEAALVSMAKDGKVLRVLQNEEQNNHAAFLHTAIVQLTNTTKIPLAQIDAVAVTAGPGSYTGIRIGMASAKGLCYALNKPLIIINNLEVLTIAAQQNIQNKAAQLYCPMIDARRMEVFTAIYNFALTIDLHPCAMVLDALSFNEQLQQHKIAFFGSGAIKWKAICSHPNASFISISNVATAMALLSSSYFTQKKIADIAYIEPIYIKEFYEKK